MNNKLLLLLFALLLLMPRGLQAAGEAYTTESEDEQVMTVCWGTEIALSDIFILNVTIVEGCGTPHFMAVRFQYDEDNTPQVLDTICRDRAGEELFNGWVNNYSIKGNRVGKYMLKFYSRCENTEFTPISGQITYRVIPEFNPGAITAGRDTMYMKDGKILVNIPSITPASGGDGNIRYRWKRGIQDMYSADENLVNYPFTYQDLTFPALLKLHRRAYDGSGCGSALAEGTYSIVVFDSLNPGRVDEVDNLEFCSVQTAQAYTITASAAEGGTERFSYQWYMLTDEAETPIAGATNKDLPLSMVEMEYGKRYTFLRKAEDDTRFTRPTPTPNRQSIYIFSGDEKRTADRLVCTSVFPVTINWYDSQGNEFSHTVTTTPDDTWNVVDEHHPSGCAADTTMNIHVALDGYVLSKFDKILYVDESQAKQLHFKAFQWYKNGQAIAGATLNYYDEDGATLDGVFEVEMTGEDGRTYRSCAMEMPQPTAINDLQQNEPALYPVPAEAGRQVTVVNNGGIVTIYSCTGERLIQIAGTEERLVMDAPETKGLYYVQIQGRDGSRRTEKLLVK